MKNSLKNIANNKDLPKLTVHEKERMLSELMCFMDAHPLPAKQSPARTFISAFLDQNLFTQWTPAYLSLMLMLTGVGFLAFTDQNREPVAAPVYVTNILAPLPLPSDTTLLEQTFKKVEAFRANPSVVHVQEIENNINEHANAVQEQILESERTGDTKQALELGSDLQNTLKMQELIITLLSTDRPEDTQAIEEVLSKIEDEGIETEVIRETLMQQLDELEQDEIRTYIGDTITELYPHLAELEGSLGTTDDKRLDDARTLLEEAKEMRERGEEFLAEEAYASALEEFLIALHTAKLASIHLEIYSKLDAE